MTKMERYAKRYERLVDRLYASWRKTEAIELQLQDLLYRVNCGQTEEGRSKGLEVSAYCATLAEQIEEYNAEYGITSDDQEKAQS
jgi:hypothetical protein